MSRRAPDHGSAPSPRALPAALAGACLATAVSAGALSACAPSGTVSAPPTSSSSGPVIGGGPGASTGHASTLLPGGGGHGVPASAAAGYARSSSAGTGPASSVAAANGVGARIVGTDADVTSAPPAAADAGLEAALREFGRLYLGFDYRIDAATRAEALRPYVTPELFAQLSAPMPAALVASLTAEQRVTEATFSDIAAIDAGVFRLRFDVHTTVASGGRTVDGGPDQTRTMTVSVDAAQLVSDVR
ncbi:MAG: Tim44 domain-containing protein [Acidimicrobiia bacterium]|nr:Tim44 domain-containing protein [Acidimicrobiia bacterium]MDH5290312.1 Tim44 domain-containing protein [Acidimicrobiia bacterium]